jgi:CheY-like chemotaxis protein
LKELFAAYEQLKVKNRKSHLKLLLKFENENEDHVIFSDPFRFRQIINNLISNALKFTDKGVIEFGYEKENINDKPFLKFYVMDTGIGIPASQLKLIFDRFGQVEDTLVRNLKGTGLGLNISKNLVEILGGKIWVESREKMGSVFYFTLPDEPPPLEKREQLIIPRKGKYNWNSKTILVAEDDKMNFNLLNIILQQAHANVLWAKTGQQAIDMFFDNKDIGLILMDIQMPEKNGYDATREIRKTDKKIPIIAQTAFAMSGEAEKSKEAGCNHYLKKPLNQDELLAIINKYLG